MDSKGISIKMSGDWFSVFIPYGVLYSLEHIGLTAFGLLDYEQKRSDEGMTIFIKSALSKGETNENQNK